MADVKFTALPAASAVTADDVLAMINDPAGTPASQKATAAQLAAFARAYGHKLDAAAAPTVNDDTADGYTVGSLWIWPARSLTWVCVDNTAGAARWLAVGPKLHPIRAAGRWYAAGSYAVAASTSAPTADTIWLSPWQLHERATISTLGARVTTVAASGNFRLGIYAADASSIPTGAALAVTGDMSTATAAFVTADITGADVMLEPGVYWTAVMLDATAAGTARFLAVTSQETIMAHAIGSPSSTNISFSVSAQVLGYSQGSVTYGTFPTIASPTEATSINATRCPLLYYLVA